MKKILLILLVLNFSSIFLSSIWSQSEIAILETKLKEGLPDTVRIDTQNALAWYLRRKDAKRAFEYTMEALIFSKKLKYSTGIGGAFKVQGALKHIEGDREEALLFYKKSIEAFRKSYYHKGISEVYLLWGNLLKSEDDFDNAVNLYYMGMESVELSETMLTKASLLMSITAIKVKQGDFTGVDSLYREAISIQKKTSPSIKYAVGYYHLATFFSITNQLDSALVYFDKAEEIFIKIELKSYLAKVYSSKGNVFYKKKYFSKAMLFYEKGLQIKKDLGDKRGEANSYNQIGNLLLEKKNYNNSRTYLIESFELAKEMNMIDLQSKTLERLAELSQQTNKPEEALKFYQQHILLRDSIFNQETEEQIAEIEEKYQNEKLQRKTEQQALENEQQGLEIKRERIVKYSITTILGLALLTMFLMFRNYKQKRKHNLLLTQQKEVLHQKEVNSLKQTSELRSLNSIQDGQEIERKRIAEALHNSMGSLLSAIQMHLQSFSTSSQKEESNGNQNLINKTIDLVKEASSTNRNIAHEMMPPILMRFGLKAALDHLTDKLKTPGVKVMTSVYGMENRYEDKLELALYRIIDELLNNILKHAQATEITVQLTEHEDLLNIIVEDNGKGFSYDPEASNYGMGISNIRARLNHFNGQLSIDSSPGNGTTISIDVPHN